jgi:hypothetical protein
MYCRSRPQYRSDLGWILGVAFLTLTRSALLLIKAGHRAQKIVIGVEAQDLCRPRHSRHRPQDQGQPMARAASVSAALTRTRLPRLPSMNISRKLLPRPWQVAEA